MYTFLYQDSRECETNHTIRSHATASYMHGHSIYTCDATTPSLIQFRVRGICHCC